MKNKATYQRREVQTYRMRAVEIEVVEMLAGRKGESVSEWVRGAIRMRARKELEEVGLEVKETWGDESSGDGD